MINFIFNTLKVNFKFYIIASLFSLLTHIGLGLPLNKYIYYPSILFLAIIIKFLYLKNRTIGNLITSILFITSLCYYSSGVIYGNISFGIVASVYETNINESLEYLAGVPTYIYLIQILYIISFIFLILESKKIQNIKYKTQNKLIYTIIVIYSLIKPIYSIVINPKDIHYSLSNSYLYPLSFYSELIKANIEYRKQRDFLNSFSQKPSTWKILSSSPKYKTYVLIIGESMRKDYMSLYNYPINTTPFLKSRNGIIFENYYSAGPNTQPSLLRTLYNSNSNNIIYSNNIISLAKQVGIKTYWLSNQGKLGQFDTVASRLGVNSDYYFFTKSLDYSSNKKYDTELLPEFNKILKDDKENTKLIILHLMGSHPEFCERIPYKTNNYFINDNMSCYLESIKYTDNFIKEIDNTLKENKQDFSVIYFSDHGLAHYDNPIKGVTLKVNNIYKQDYEIPFILFSSDSKEQIRIKERQSAFNFLSGFAQWLGIKEENLLKTNFFNPTSQNIQVYDWEKMLDIDKLKDDPAKYP